MKTPVFTAILMALGCSIACAQASSADRDVANAKKAHNDCVMNSVAAQIEAIPPAGRRKADISMLAEQGFIACQTEEKLLTTTMELHRTPPRMIEVYTLKNRLDTKRELQAISANPSAYQQKQAR